MDYQDYQAKVRTLEANLEALPEFQELQTCQKAIANINAEIRGMVDAQGSYQDIENGFYAVKQRRESIIYKPELVRQYAPSKVASFVLIESVDSKALDALIKAGQVTPEVARQCGEVKETNQGYRKGVEPLMGYYIEVPEKFKKAGQLVKLYKGEIVPCPKTFSDIPDGKALICVVDNRAFEAAGYCYDSQEFNDFKHPDGRPRTWLLMDETLVHKLTGFI